MKKIFLTAAALTVGTLAQAQSSITLYGTADVYVESLKVSGKSADTRLTSGGLAPSKWGMRGSEDLGGGLKAVFHLESGFAIDSGAVSGAMFSRAANVGLTSPVWGEVRLGRQNAPMNDAMVWTDTDWASNFSANSPLLLNNDPVAGLYHLRQSNLISYTSPLLNGFDAKLAFGPGESTPLNAAGTVTARNTFGAMLRYKSGPLLTTAALHRGGQNTPTGANKQAAYNLAARYDFGPLTLSGDYYQSQTKLASGAEPKLQAAVVGMLVPQGAWAYVAQYGYVKDNGLNIAGVAKGKGTSELFNVGAHYFVSKRTILYTRLAKAMDSGNGFNGQSANAGIAFGGAVPVNGSARTLAVGVYHSF
ncbi:porin [Polaromonas hydrogenivorans]|uniref:Porin n=1 Tax=Polaromonas hydrogenivorans TaxID=335476 RepID=A0AAU7M1J3_9BURK